MAPGLPAALATIALSVLFLNLPRPVAAFVGTAVGKRLCNTDRVDHYPCLQPTATTCSIRPLHSQRSTSWCSNSNFTLVASSSTSSSRNSKNGGTSSRSGNMNMAAKPSNTDEHRFQEKNAKISERTVSVPPAARAEEVDRETASMSASTESSLDQEEDTYFLAELLARCDAATRPGAATESNHSGSSEWAGFRTTKSLLDGVTEALDRARQRSRRGDGSAMAWSWLTLSPRPVRLAVAVDNPRFACYLTVLPAGNGSPASHRPMYGCHMLSRVLAGEVEQVKSNSQRVIGRSTHSVETPVWSSYGGGARRLINESFLPAIVLEVVLYDWSRGSGYSGSYSAPGTSRSQSAERRIESGSSAASEGPGGDTIDTLICMDECPCDPALLFRDGDKYEDEEEEEGGAGGANLVLVRTDGKVVHGRGSIGGEGEGGDADGATAATALGDMLTVGELACDVGGLDGQLEDITRRILATRSLPAEMRKALGVSHVRGLLLHGPPGCGKTLLARELSRRLGARPPKLVSGPEILDKWVGEAERKVRLLFLDAELEHERCVQMGEDPGALPLNLICFDEIDALCRSRGALSGDTSGVRDSVVNQILSKMDGLVNLQNVLVVGMTNRKELLDEALLRPGRMEVCMHIPLPDSDGRRQILGIHLKKARDAGLVAREVDDQFLGDQTAGFSGADLAGLVRSATSFAIADWRQGASTGVQDEDMPQDAERLSREIGESGGVGRGLMVTAANFEAALAEVQPSVKGGLKRRWRQRFASIF